MEKLEKAISRIKNELPELELAENEELCAYSSFKIGGAARVIAKPADSQQLQKLCRLLKAESVRPLPLGRGFFGRTAGKIRFDFSALSAVPGNLSYDQ